MQKDNNGSSIKPKVRRDIPGNFEFNNEINDFILQKITNYKKSFEQFLDLLPVPIEIFNAGGVSVFLNQAALKWLNINDPKLIVGKYNLIKDPVCNDQLGLRKDIEKVFYEGVPCTNRNINPPVQDLVDRGVVNKKPFEQSVADFHYYPIKYDKKVAYVVFICIVKKTYIGRPELVRAMEYIDSHWKGKFDPETFAKSVNMSLTHIYSIFNKDIGMTPGEYRNRVKVEHIKEKLADKNLSIKEAFAICGEDSRGWLSKVFKKITGLSPSEFREKN